MTKVRRKGGAQFQGGWREKTAFSTVLQSFAVFVKGSVTEEWFSGVLRSFLEWVLLVLGFGESSEKTGWGSPRDVGEKKVCKREVLQ